jgi:GNAT superfamily N-acetyltransferase
MASGSMAPEILVTDTPDQAAYDVILTGIVAYNDIHAQPDRQRVLAVLVKDDAGKVLGGLWGATAWQWLFVRLLWPPEALRGAGLGRKLMDRAEAEAVTRGCGNVWLDTYSFQARGFYEKLAYTVFGTLEDYPPGNRCYFLQKRLG